MAGYEVFSRIEDIARRQAGAGLRPGGGHTHAGGEQDHHGAHRRGGEQEHRALARGSHDLHAPQRRGNQREPQGREPPPRYPLRRQDDPQQKGSSGPFLYGYRRAVAPGRGGGAALRHSARRPDRGAAVSRRPVQLGHYDRRGAAGSRHERTGIHGGRRQGPYPPACQLVQHRLLGQQRQRPGDPAYLPAGGRHIPAGLFFGLGQAFPYPAQRLEGDQERGHNRLHPRTRLDRRHPRRAFPDRRGARRKRRGSGPVRLLRPPAPLPGLAGEPGAVLGLFHLRDPALGGDRVRAGPQADQAPPPAQRRRATSPPESSTASFPSGGTTRSPS